MMSWHCLALLLVTLVFVSVVVCDNVEPHDDDNDGIITIPKLKEYRIKSVAECHDLELLAKIRPELGFCDQSRQSTFLFDTIHGK